jgi:hypothetical protein
MPSSLFREGSVDFGPFRLERSGERMEIELKKAFWD